MMDPPRAKYSGGKLPSRSDLRVEGVRGESTSKISELRMDFCNIRGLSSNINSVHQHLQNVKPHLLALTETQVKPSVNTSHLLCPNFELHTRFRFKGGVCVFVRSDLSCHREESLEPPNKDIMWLKISSKSITKFICVLYLSPSDSTYKELFSDLSITFDHLQVKYPDAEIIFLGDFNVHNVPWLKFSSRTNDAGREAEAFAISCGITQLVEEPTRIPDNRDHMAYLLDLFLTTCPEGYGIKVTSPLGNSDHKLITATSSLQIQQNTHVPPRKTWHYGAARWDELRNFFASFPWKDVCFGNDDTSAVASSISEVILIAMETSIPFSYKKQHPGKSWFDKSCARAVSQKNSAYRKWRNNPTDQSREHFVTTRNACKAVIDQTKASFDNKIREKVLNCPSGSKSFWSFAKSIGKNFTTSSFPPLLSDDGSSIAVTSKEKADLFASIFAQNSTLEDQNREPPLLPRIEKSMREIVFRPKTIKKILLHLDTTKASGTDNIPAIVLKKCALELTPILCKLFELSYKKGIFPDTWKNARVQPVPKKGKKNLASNYRPISLTPIISKVMERAINTELLKYLEINKII